MATRLMENERRRQPRIRERVILALQHDEQGVLEAETQNLSASGVYCTIEQFIPPLTKLQLESELPHGPRVSRIRCTGVVVRVEPILSSADRWRYRIAIFFNDLLERDRAVISQFVVERLASPAP